MIWLSYICDQCFLSPKIEFSFSALRQVLDKKFQKDYEIYDCQLFLLFQNMFSFMSPMHENFCFKGRQLQQHLFYNISIARSLKKTNCKWDRRFSLGLIETIS